MLRRMPREATQPSPERPPDPHPAWTHEQQRAHSMSLLRSTGGTAELQRKRQAHRSLGPALGPGAAKALAPLHPDAAQPPIRARGTHGEPR
jgi:hypothetical protein